MKIASKRLQREDYWNRELNTVYPYGLYVQRVGNISKNREGIVVWNLSKKQIK